MKLLLTLLLLSLPVMAQEDDPLLKGCQLCVSRLNAANERIAALTQLNQDKDAIIAASRELLALKDQTIANLKQIDTNSQKIDTNSTEITRIFREQIADDRMVKAALENKLEACQERQKYVALFSGIAGGFVGYKIRGTTFQNPFVIPQSNFSLFQSSAEQRAREAMKALRK